MAAATASPPPSLASPRAPPTTPQPIGGTLPTRQLQSCTELREVHQIHGSLVASGLAQLPSAASRLVASYSRIPTPDGFACALRAFELSGHEAQADLFLWNSLIRACCRIGCAIEEAVGLYLRLVRLGLTPDRFTFPPLLAVCAKALAFAEGEQLHGVVHRMGADGGVGADPFVHNSLVYFYAECGDLESAQRMFDRMTERNVVSWTCLIDGHAHGDCPEKAVSLFHDMIREGRIRPNSVTMACVLSACAKLQDLEQGEEICAYILDSGIGFGSLMNSVIDMYMRCRAVERARQLFDDCSDRDTVLWNIMLSGYEQHGMPEEALSILNEMLMCGEQLDRVSVLVGCSATAQLSDPMFAKQLHGHILRNGLDCWDTVNNSMIEMYMKCHEQDTACKLFDLMPNKTVSSWNTLIIGFSTNGDNASAWEHFEIMPERNIVSWNTMIAALVRGGQYEKAIDLFLAMQGADLKPDTPTMVSVAIACGCLGSFDLAKLIHAYIKKSGIFSDVKLETALMDMFARCGDSRSSMQMFDQMRTRDVAAWTAAIRTMAFEGNGIRALQIFHEMIDHGVRPDGLAFVGVLTACSHSGLVEEGRRFFESMSRDHGFVPQIIHYSCMVDLLARAGLLADAQTVIESMPMEPNDVIWRTLVSCSRVHRDLEMAEYAAKKVQELAPEATGAPVLLSNAYASAGRWRDVATVRLHLHDKGAQKITGSSKIEVNGVIHRFTSCEESHVQVHEL